MASTAAITVEEIKRLVTIAMVSDDDLYECLVLKGGNALNLIHRLSSRASVDLDFSMQHDIPESTSDFLARIERTLLKTMVPRGYIPFDFKMEEKPRSISEDIAGFWGGYAIEFKLVDEDTYEAHKDSIDSLRKQAVSIGQGKKFLIDLSRFEYTLGKQDAEIDGYRIYAYSPQMIVCEKLRAICQQMPEYGAIVHRTRAGTARARDFFDIHLLISRLLIDVTTDENIEILKGMFDAKRVPLELLERVHESKDFHIHDFASIQATVPLGTELHPFDFYFDYVIELINRIKTPLAQKYATL